MRRGLPSKHMLDRIPFLSSKFDDHMQEVLGGAAVAFVLQVFGRGMAFGFIVFLARMVGADGLGVYSLVLTVATISAVFGRMGLNNSLLRFTAANAATRNWPAVKGVYRKSMALGLAASVVVTLALAAMAPWLATRVFSKAELAGPLRWMALAVVPSVLLFLQAESLRGLKRIRDSQIVRWVGVPLFSLLGLALLGRRWGVLGAIWAYSLAAWLTALIGYFMWLLSTPQLRNTAGQFETRELLQSSMPLFWMALMNMVINWTGYFVLGVWGTKAEVGVYGAAFRTAMLASIILNAVNVVAAPKFAALYKQGDNRALASTVRSSARLITFLAVPALLVCIVIPGKVMRMFGPEFTAGASALTILAAAQFVNAATGPVSYLLMMSGNERLMRNITTAGAAANLLLALLLVPRFGFLGAALAAAISLAGQNLLSAYMAYAVLGINVLYGKALVSADVRGGGNRVK